MTIPLVDLATRTVLFCSQPDNTTENLVFEDVSESPVEWDAFVGTFACEVKATNSRTHFKEYPKVLQNS